MKLYSTKTIAAAFRGNSTATIRWLKSNGFTPHKEIKTPRLTYRFWTQEAMSAAIKHSAEKDNLAKQNESDFKPEDAPALQVEEKEVGRVKEAGMDITIIETHHANKMLDILTAIDAKLGKLLQVWEAQ